MKKNKSVLEVLIEMKNIIVNFINCLFNQKGNLNNNLEKNSSTKLDTYINKEVIVITPDNIKYKIKQYCNHIDNKKLVLLSESNYDKTKKIYHTYYDCYEDWPQSEDFKFSKWKLTDKKSLKDYTECCRCFEREYRYKHPNAKITGFTFNYYYENLRRTKMNALDMYKIAENEKIDVLNYKWTNTKARIFEINNNYYIALDNSQITNSIEEKEILAEELRALLL